MNPRNVGEIENADGVGEVGNPVCGDMMTFYIRVDQGRLSEIKFKTFGCGAAIAVSSMVSEMALGKAVEEAMQITREDVAERLGGLPSEKMHCSNLGADALRRAIHDYLDRQGNTKEDSVEHSAQGAQDGILDRSLLDDDALVKLILEVKRKKNAVILVHNYQRPDIQDIGDFVGDSLGLALKASETDMDVIVFCGVHFMAETASILNPDRIVLLPEIRAGCPMADMAPVEAVRRAKELHPNSVVVSYVNTTAAVKAESDYCCTSSNAVRVTRVVEGREILFLPDRNLAAYVAKHVPEKRIIPWDGYCHVHQDITVKDVMEVLANHPGAEIIAHPECTEEVLSVADHIRSTSGMVAAALESSADEFVVATEAGMVYPLKRAVPNKSFYPTANEPFCPNMKLITLPKVLLALENLEPRVTVPEDVRVRALLPVERMLGL